MFTVLTPLRSVLICVAVLSVLGCQEELVSPVEALNYVSIGVDGVVWHLWVVAGHLTWVCLPITLVLEHSMTSPLFHGLMIAIAGACASLAIFVLARVNMHRVVEEERLWRIGIKLQEHLLVLVAVLNLT